MTAPLAGLKVLDFTTLLPGPLATLMLADAGATVVKVENPKGGDPGRANRPAMGGISVQFALLNRAKRSIAADLKNPADHATPPVRPLPELQSQDRAAQVAGGYRLPGPT